VALVFMVVSQVVGVNIILAVLETY
jgi:hypothetical protein